MEWIFASKAIRAWRIGRHGPNNVTTSHKKDNNACDFVSVMPADPLNLLFRIRKAGIVNA
eukprot:6117559-Amphidinium_carterae.1